MFMSLIRKRRSIRKYQAREVEGEKLDLLVEAAMRSPSSRGLNPWQVVVVRDRDTLDRLAESKPHGGAFLKNAPLGMVVLADPERCDVWVEDASILSVFVQLAAESLGLGSCWVQIRKRGFSETETAEKKVAEILGVPGNLKVESIIAVGYPDEEKKPHSKDSLPYEKVFYDRYGNTGA
jgi:nitroreductase